MTLYEILFYQASGCKSTAIVIDDANSEAVVYPISLKDDFSNNKSIWLNYYAGEKGEARPKMFEICENQFKKYKDEGILPQNWDW